jgi:hypothetical protein
VNRSKLKNCRLILVALFLCFAVSGFAGERGPGKYSGVVVFDRWDGCTLYSGIYVMYVSEKTKEALRQYEGQAVQINTKEVNQPINPGDGLIGKFEYLGPSPNGRDWIKLDGIQLASSISANTNGQPIATLVITNSGTIPIKIFSSELGLTLLKKKSGNETNHWWFPSDGPSFALITRQDFDGRKGNGGVEAGTSYSWTICKENILPHDFTLEARTQKTLTIYFNLPDGEYDFLGGYAGGVHETKCLASNLSVFDVNAGKATIIQHP